MYFKFRKHPLFLSSDDDIEVCHSEKDDGNDEICDSNDVIIGK